MEQRDGLKARISGVFGMEYGVCSIVAAEANRHAMDMANAKNFSRLNVRKHEVFLADSFGANTETACIPIIGLAEVSINPKLNPVHDNRASLVLMMHETADPHQYEPRLAVVVEDNIALELARFDTRTDRNCRHIQLGSEITDDNLLVTQADEEADSGRAKTVRAIRSILESCNENHETFEEDMEDIIESFIESELSRNADVIEKMRIPSICRKLTSKFHSDPRRVRMNLYKDSGEGTLIVNSEEDTSILVDNVYLGDGTNENRRVKIALTQSPDSSHAQETKKSRGIFKRFSRDSSETSDNPNPVKLVAIVRDSIAIDLATFTDGQVFVSDSGEVGNMRIANDMELRYINRLVDIRRKTELTAKTILRLQDTESKIDGLIGEYTPKLEKIIESLGRLAARGDYKPAPIMIEDVELGGTSTDALLDVTITQPENGVYAFSLTARPAMMEDQPPAQIFDNLRFFKYALNHHSDGIVDDVSDVIEQLDGDTTTQQNATIAQRYTVTDNPSWWKNSKPSTDNRRFYP